MTATKTKNDTSSVTAAIMTVNVDKNKKTSENSVANKPKVKEKPKAFPAPAKAEEGKEQKKDETAVIMSTDAFSKEILTEYQRRTKAIKNSISKIDSSFETIAFNLHWINAKQAYKSEGFSSIVDYAADHFGYQKTTCYSLIAVVDRFAKRDEKGMLTESFDERVKGYSVSKLSLMVNLTDAEIDTLKPSMSVRDIKKFVKSLEGKALPELSEGDGEVPEEDNACTENSGTEDACVVDADAVVISDVLIECKGMDDYSKKAEKIDKYVQRVFKHYPDAVIKVFYSLPPKKETKA